MKAPTNERSPLMEPIGRRAAIAALVAPIVAGCRASDLLAPSFASSSASATGAITLVGGGDQHTLAANTAFRTGRMVQSVLDANPGALAYAVGDLVPSGTAAEFQNYNAAWGAFKDRTFFALGNHDWYPEDPAATAYFDYVGSRGGPRAKGWYAVNLGDWWRCYVLNSEKAPSDEQRTWLAADLASNAGSGRRIMAMWHVPRFASVCAHNGKAMTWPKPLSVWWKLLQERGAEFVISGHVHRYERFAKLSYDGSASADGMRQFITGVGGVKNMDILTVHPKSERQVIAKGIVRFDLYPDRYEWTFTDVAGVVRDQGSQATRLTGAIA